MSSRDECHESQHTTVLKYLKIIHELEHKTPIGLILLPRHSNCQGGYRSRRGDKMPKTPALDVSNLNPNVLNAEYAVRGAIAIKAQEFVERMRQGEDLGFQSIVQCNIGTQL